MKVGTSKLRYEDGSRDSRVDATAAFMFQCVSLKKAKIELELLVIFGPQSNLAGEKTQVTGTERRTNRRQVAILYC